MSDVSLNVAMAILIGGHYWPWPDGTALICFTCGDPASFLRDVAGRPTAAWVLACPTHKGGSPKYPTHPIPPAILAAARGAQARYPKGSGHSRTGSRPQRSAMTATPDDRALARVAEHEPFVDDDRMISCVCGHLVGRVNDPESFYTHIFATQATKAGEEK